MEENKEARPSARRMLWLAAVILLIFLFFAARLFFIQIADREGYGARQGDVFSEEESPPS